MATSLLAHCYSSRQYVACATFETGNDRAGTQACTNQLARHPPTIACKCHCHKPCVHPVLRKSVNYPLQAAALVYKQAFTHNSLPVSSPLRSSLCLFKASKEIHNQWRFITSLCCQQHWASKQATVQLPLRTGRTAAAPHRRSAPLPCCSCRQRTPAAYGEGSEGGRDRRTWHTSRCDDHRHGFRRMRWSRWQDGSGIGAAAGMGYST